MTEDEAALLTFGTTEPPPARHVLQAGALRCVLEAGVVRHVTWRGVEVLRGIAYLLRDTDWGTPSSKVGGLAVEEDADAFRVSFESCTAVGDATFIVTARIEGRADGSLVFDATGVADGPIDTCRCGFVVLHSAAVAGLDLEVEHTGGAVSHMRFPTEISPSQPVLDIRALTCRPAPWIAVTCRMEADLPLDPAGKFEMEDQRNWSDASFKTYVGSLLDPWPYRLEAGVARRQRVEVAIKDDGPAMPAIATGDAAPHIELVDAGRMRLPEIGMGVPQGAAGIDDAAAARVAALGPRWLVVSLELDTAGQREQLAAAATLARRCGARIQLEIVLPALAPANVELAAAAHLCAEAGLSPAAVLACPRAMMRSYQPSDSWPDVPPPDACAEAARAAFPGARIGAGMVTYYTELNRFRPGGQAFDFIGHATAPIVHAADDVSVMETLESLPHMARSVRAIWPGRGHRIGPSSLAMRSNPYGAALVPNPDLRRAALAGEDPRQHGLFAAAWTIGYAAALAPEGTEMVALHATHGASTLLAMPVSSQLPLPSGATVPPVFHALRWLARGGGQRAMMVLGAPPGLGAVAWVDDNSTRVALANLTPTSLRVRLDGVWRAQTLDLHGVLPALRDEHWLDRTTLAGSVFGIEPYASLFLHNARDEDARIGRVKGRRSSSTASLEAHHGQAQHGLAATGVNGKAA
ncbi:hypothetical protein [Falsiroseomonas sp. HW251]|uniref:hypothetical protein n=1 Tax=Falsiroseomonas sp. HW251 TaxID=3390998 RepID=UPI003D310C9B